MRSLNNKSFNAVIDKVEFLERKIEYFCFINIWSCNTNGSTTGGSNGGCSTALPDTGGGRWW